MERLPGLAAAVFGQPSADLGDYLGAVKAHMAQLSGDVTLGGYPKSELSRDGEDLPIFWKRGRGWRGCPLDDKSFLSTAPAAFPAVNVGRYLLSASQGSGASPHLWLPRV